MSLSWCYRDSPMLLAWGSICLKKGIPFRAFTTDLQFCTVFLVVRAVNICPFGGACLVSVSWLSGSACPKDCPGAEPQQVHVLRQSCTCHMTCIIGYRTVFDCPRYLKLHSDTSGQALSFTRSSEGFGFVGRVATSLAWVLVSLGPKFPLRWGGGWAGKREFPLSVTFWDSILDVECWGGFLGQGVGLVRHDIGAQAGSRHVS